MGIGKIITRLYKRCHRAHIRCAHSKFRQYPLFSFSMGNGIRAYTILTWPTIRRAESSRDRSLKYCTTIKAYKFTAAGVEPRQRSAEEIVLQLQSLGLRRPRKHQYKLLHLLLKTQLDKQSRHSRPYLSILLTRNSKPLSSRRYQSKLEAPN